MNEKMMQTILLRYVMNEKHHDFAVPNSTCLFHWEADLISVTKAGLSHEYEIKVSRSDFLADSKKHKHHFIGGADLHHTPNYFWYAINGFEIGINELPDYAGCLKVVPHKDWFVVDVIKYAPRLHTNKVTNKDIRTIARLLSYRAMSDYCKMYLSGK